MDADGKYRLAVESGFGPHRLFLAAVSAGRVWIGSGRRFVRTILLAGLVWSHVNVFKTISRPLSVRRAIAGAGRHHGASDQGKCWI